MSDFQHGSIHSVKYKPTGDAELKKSPGVGKALREVAEKQRGRVHAPSGYTVSARGGVGPRGAFAQVIMNGPRAIFVEFGTRAHSALAPLRSAILGRRS